MASVGEMEKNSEPANEMGETAMNETLLKQIATISGGAFLREEDLCKLPDMVRARPAEVTSTIEAELWASPLLYILLLTIGCVEWAVRKMSQLK